MSENPNVAVLRLMLARAERVQLNAGSTFDQQRCAEAGVEAVALRAAIAALEAQASAPGGEVTEADIDIMRDVYMTRAQREAYERIVATARQQEAPHADR